MLRIIKDVIRRGGNAGMLECWKNRSTSTTPSFHYSIISFCLFLLAGILFIQDSHAQFALTIKGGGDNGISSASAGACTPVKLPGIGGSYDGSGIITAITCTIPTSQVISGGGNTGFTSASVGGCTPTLLPPTGGSYDGSGLITAIACTIPTSQVISGGGNTDFTSASVGACTPTLLPPTGGSYDGSGLITAIACTIPTSQVISGGGNTGYTSASVGACTPTLLPPIGGSYDGASLITAIACTIPTSQVITGGGNTGLTSASVGACTPTLLPPKGGAYDGSDAKVLRCNPSLYIASVTTTGVLCQCNGTATVSAVGGTAPYNYQWSSGSTNVSSTGLCSGVYYVTITDAALVNVVGSTTVGQTGLILSPVVSITPATCGNSNGSASVSVSGGVAPYTYLWYNGATTTSISSLSSGTYTVTIGDAASCTATATAILTQPPLIAATISSQTNISCFGSTDGSVTVTVSGGTPLYTYSWNNGATTASLSSLAAGTYTVTVTDNLGCTSITTATITTPPALTSPISSQTDVSCNGNTDGSVTVNPSGGTIPYTYIWNTSPVQTTATANNLAVGIYTLTVTDAHNCTTTTTTTITQPAVLSVSASVNSPVCYGTSINLTSTPTGGTTVYNYSWTGPASYTSTDGNPTIASATTANSGTYYLTVTDANGCTASSSASVVVTICTTTLNLNVYIEGYYIGSSQMQPTVLNESVPTATGAETDTIYVLLHDIGNPAIVSDSASAILMTTGSATAVFNGTATGNSYWIAIRHRNTVETWSNTPVLFNPITSYDFTTAASQAYGGNMIQVDFSPDLWAVYNGDINQDQNVDLLDFPDMDYGINNGLFGYYNTDLNGDGNVDLLDFPVLDANINNGIYSSHP